MNKIITVLFLLFLSFGVPSIHAGLQTSARFSISGEVRKPGVYSVEGPSSVLKLLTLAGSTAERAGSKVLIIRHNTSHSEPNYQLITISLIDLLKGQDVPLELGDAVYLPAELNVYVTGEVKAPGSFRFRKGMTLRQVISLAEGVQSVKPVSGFIIREDEVTGTKKKIKMNISLVVSGRAEDILLEPNDVVVVGEPLREKIFPSIDVPPKESLPLRGIYRA